MVGGESCDLQFELDHLHVPLDKTFGILLLLFAKVAVVVFVFLGFFLVGFALILNGIMLMGVIVRAMVEIMVIFSMEEIFFHLLILGLDFLESFTRLHHELLQLRQFLLFCF